MERMIVVTEVTSNRVNKHLGDNGVVTEIVVSLVELVYKLRPVNVYTQILKLSVIHAVLVINELKLYLVHVIQDRAEILVTGVNGLTTVDAVNHVALDHKHDLDYVTTQLHKWVLFFV